ncbi:MAG: hypothetical protein J6T10_29845 [Methanobrevibacter sp.]|nr:hypothetical protein [Methanobrevibacter sp.]
MITTMIYNTKNETAQVKVFLENSKTFKVHSTITLNNGKQYTSYLKLTPQEFAHFCQWCYDDCPDKNPLDFELKEMYGRLVLYYPDDSFKYHSSKKATVATKFLNFDKFLFIGMQLHFKQAVEKTKK